MRWFAILSFVVAVSGCAISPGSLKDFASDGCSCFPDGTPGDPARWKAHCVSHDLAYWKGGTAEDRLKADRQLRQKVAEEGHPVIAEWMYLGTRLGGSPWWPTPWRWGFGWPYPRGYGALTEGQQGQVSEKWRSQALVE